MLTLINTEQTLYHIRLRNICRVAQPVATCFACFFRWYVLKLDIRHGMCQIFSRCHLLRRCQSLMLLKIVVELILNFLTLTVLVWYHVTTWKSFNHVFHYVEFQPRVSFLSHLRHCSSISPSHPPLLHHPYNLKIEWSKLEIVLPDSVEFVKNFMPKSCLSMYLLGLRSWRIALPPSEPRRLSFSLHDGLFNRVTSFCTNSTTKNWSLSTFNPSISMTLGLPFSSSFPRKRQNFGPIFARTSDVGPRSFG